MIYISVLVVRMLDGKDVYHVGGLIADATRPSACWIDRAFPGILTDYTKA